MTEREQKILYLLGVILAYMPKGRAFSIDALITEVLEIVDAMSKRVRK